MKLTDLGLQVALDALNNVSISRLVIGPRLSVEDGDALEDIQPWTEEDAKFVADEINDHDGSGTGSEEFEVQAYAAGLEVIVIHEYSEIPGFVTEWLDDHRLWENGHEIKEQILIATLSM